MKKILVSILIIAAFSIGVVGYQYSNRGNSMSSKDQTKRTNKPTVAKVQKADNVAKGDKSSKNPITTVSSAADFSVLYTNLNDLVQAADVIIEGEVIGISYFDHNTVTYTKALVKVTKSYTSNTKPGDVLTFANEGGITTKANLMRYSNNKFNQPIGEAEENTKVEVGGINGEPLTAVGEKVVYFAVNAGDFFQRGLNGSFEAAGSPNRIPGTFYGTVGAYQGRFTINSDSIVQRYVPKGDEISKYTSLKMGKANFDQQLAGAVKNKK